MYQTTSEITKTRPAALFQTPSEHIFQTGEFSRTARTVLAADAAYTVKLVENAEELAEWLGLRYRVFRVELGGETKSSDGMLETDEYDASSHHLIAVENRTGRIIGGYRLRTAEMNTPELGFYSAGEFRVGDLPFEIIGNSVEIGRACIEPAHRSGKVLFMLWKGLAQYVLRMRKRYLFGCCSLFTDDRREALIAYEQIAREGFLHEELFVAEVAPDFFEEEPFGRSGAEEMVELPKLFKTYLRIGAKVCSRPVIDREFGSIDFFVIFDSLKLSEKYRKMFFS